MLFTERGVRGKITEGILTVIGHLISRDNVNYSLTLQLIQLDNRNTGSQSLNHLCTLVCFLNLQKNIKSSYQVSTYSMSSLISKRLIEILLDLYGRNQNIFKKNPRNCEIKFLNSYVMKSFLSPETKLKHQKHLFEENANQ